MIYILYKSAGVYSGRVLRKELDKLYKGTVVGGYPKRLAGFIRRGKKPSMIINLGTTDDIDKYDGAILNSQDMVRSASNKRKARVTFGEAEVPAPDLFLQSTQIPQEAFPVIGRISYHKKGQGFWFCKTPAEARRATNAGATHFLNFISGTREYRVHAFIKQKYLTIPPKEREVDHYVSIKISEKVWEGKNPPDPAQPQKNHEFGWVFRGEQDRRKEELDVVRYAAKQAIAALGMDFGAVDVMYRIRTKTPLVLEVNSTPSLADDSANTCEVYAKRIIKILSDNKES